jgi:AraC-like DNA-binding protein
MGNRYNYYDVFKKYVGKYNKKKFQKALDEAMKITPDEIIHNGHRYELVDHIVEARPKDDTQEAQNKALRDIALNTAKNLRAEGKSLAEIAKIMGYDDPAVVRTILPNAW